MRSSRHEFDAPMVLNRLGECQRLLLLLVDWFADHDYMSRGVQKQANDHNNAYFIFYSFRLHCSTARFRNWESQDY